MRSCCVAVLALASLAPVASADTTYYAPHHQVIYRHHRERHPVRKTIKRVGIGAAGGAAIGALAGGGKGAAIGALAGGAAGAIYDHHEKRRGR